MSSWIRLLSAPLATLERQPLWDTMAKEVVGINAPKVVFTRTWDEKIDVAVNEFGNTVGFVGAGLGAEYLLNKFFQTPAAKKLFAEGQGKAWEVLGRSFAIYSAVFSVMWAMPFIRNYITAKRTGQVDYTEVIGAKKRPDPKKQGNALEKRHEKLHEKLKEYQGQTLKILGLGALGVGLSIGGGLLAARFKVPLGAVGNWISKHLTLAEGRFTDFSGIKALLFWGVPAYGGWIHASRDPYEKKEQVFKFFNFVACFIGPQMLLKQLFKSRFAALLPKGVETTFASITQHLQGDLLQKALKLKVIQEIAGLASSIGLLGISPAVLNITLTQKRLEQSQHRAVAFENASLAHGDFQRRSFEGFLDHIARQRRQV